MTYPIATIMAGLVTAYVMATFVATLIARAGFPLPPSKRRIGCIDGLRGYLALSVLAYHFILWIQVTRLGGRWAPTSVHLFNQLGAGGVALFFMTTGLVFYPRVLAGFRACSWPAIYTARLFRIVPLVIVSVGIITTIVAARTGRGLDSAFPLAAAKWITTWSMPPLLGYPDSGRLDAYVLWSLWYEWLFYLLVLPACALTMDLVRGRLPSWVPPAALLMASLIGHAFRPPGGIMTYLPLFAIGMLAYECQRRGTVVQWLCTSGATAAATAALGVGMVFNSTPYTFFAMPLFGFFFICVACGNSMGGILRTRGALVLGECSYGIYLLHGILLSVLFVDAAALTGSVATDRLSILLPVAATVAILITPATYLLIERPAMRVGSWASRRWTNRRLHAVPSKLEAVP